MLVSLTVGKVDAGVTVLLTPDKRLIEFPSILLPPNITSGSIVDITVGRNLDAETNAEDTFQSLQERIFESFGATEPAVPSLRCRNATQTSVVLEWDPVELATAELISLSLYRNGQKAGNIPKPMHMHSTKISGLAVDTEYTFHLVLRTTAGTFTSDKVQVKTHKLTDLSGITITTGVLPTSVKEQLNAAVERIGAKIVDGVRIDTTHFVTTEGRGMAWEKAVENNIPVVRPEWVDACEKNGRILGVTKFYLDAMRPGPPTPGENPNASQKDLPPPPPPPQQSEQVQQPGSGQPAAEGDDELSATAYTAAATTPSKASISGTDKGGDDDDDDDSVDENKDDGKEQEAIAAETTEQKTRSLDPNEQKMRVEDKDNQHNLALRPGGQDETAAEGDDKSDPNVASSRASFQNVEL